MCMLDHLIPHHLPNSSSTQMLLRLNTNHPFCSNSSHQPSPSILPGTCYFCPKNVQVVRVSDIEVEVESFISELKLSVQNSAQVFSSSFQQAGGFWSESGIDSGCVHRDVASRKRKRVLSFFFYISFF